MSDIKSRLIDGLQGQAIKLPAMYGNRWLLIDKENLGWIAERLLSLDGIAIVDTSAIESAAKAIFANRRHHEPVHAWDDLYSDEMDSYRAMARAALAAAVQAQEGL